MCLTVPRKVTKVDGEKFQLNDGRWVKSLVGPLKPGEMVLAQANLAIEKVSPNSVKQMKEILLDTN